MRALQGKEEELNQREGDKAVRKELKQELSRAKKTLREKDRELAKLRQEALARKGQENNSFTTKEAPAAIGRADSAEKG